MELTKEEFGLDLYEAMAACAGVQQLLRMIAAQVTKGKDPAHLSAQYAKERERAKLLAQADSISQEDAARLARRYPWLLV